MAYEPSLVLSKQEDLKQESVSSPGLDSDKSHKICKCFSKQMKRKKVIDNTKQAHKAT